MIVNNIFATQLGKYPATISLNENNFIKALINSANTHKKVYDIKFELLT